MTLRIGKREVLKLWNSGLHSARGIAFELGFHGNTGAIAVREILLAAGKPARRKFTRRDDDAIRRLYSGTKASTIAKKLIRTISSIYGRAQKLGVHPNTVRGKFPKGFHFYPAGEFKKGQISWNKGKHIGTHGRSAETQFKKGHISANKLPVGSIQKRTDCHNTGRTYQWIKVKEPNEWKELHRYLWEKYRGRIPKDRLVAFVDGNSLHCSLRTRAKNLELITRAENAIRNQQTDGYVAARMAMIYDNKPGCSGFRHPRLDEKLFRKILQDKPLVEAYRQEMILRRRLKAHAKALRTHDR